MGGAEWTAALDHIWGGLNGRLLHRTAHTVTHHSATQETHRIVTGSASGHVCPSVMWPCDLLFGLLTVPSTVALVKPWRLAVSKLPVFPRATTRQVCVCILPLYAVEVCHVNTFCVCILPWYHFLCVRFDAHSGQDFFVKKQDKCMCPRVTMTQNWHNFTA